MTKKEMFTAIRTTLSEGTPATAEMLEFIAHQIELLDRKRSGTSTKSKAKQAEHDAIKDSIMRVLHDAGAATLSEIVAALSDAGTVISSQKANSMVKQLKDAGLVTREVKDKRAYFSIATDEGEGV